MVELLYFGQRNHINFLGFAKLIWQHIPTHPHYNSNHCIDEEMHYIAFRKPQVSLSHVDEDFEGPNGSVALCSILI